MDDKSNPGERLARDLAWNEIADRFEHELQLGRNPIIESYLTERPSEESASLLQLLLKIEIERRVARGETPTPADYETRFDRHFVANAFEDIEETLSYDCQRRGAPDQVGGTQFKPGQMIGQFKVERCLGEGNWGVVYLGSDTVLDRPAALKLPRQDIDEEIFFREAKIAAQLDHPGIVSLYSAAKTNDGVPFVAMRFVDGQTLRDAWPEIERSPKAAANLMARIADAVDHAHRHKVYHRDIKPSNVMLVGDTGQPVILDFGLAICSSEQWLHRGDTSGTPAYRSPEQVRGDAHWIDGRSDIWSLGVMLYEMLTGERPFQGATVAELDDQILSRPIIPLRTFDTDIPIALEDACLKALCRSPDDRPKLASDWAQMLRISVLGEAGLDILIESAKQKRDIDIQTETPTYQVGDQIRVRMRSTQDCHLWLVNIGTSGNQSTLLPNPRSSLTRLKAHHWTDFPSDADNFSLPLSGPPGRERLVAIATDDELNDELRQSISLQDLRVGADVSGAGENPIYVVGLRELNFIVEASS